MTAWSRPVWLRGGGSAAMGWRQLTHGRARMIVALAGVAVSVLLMLTVLSLKEAVVRSSLQVPGSLRGDILVLSPRTQSVMRPARLPERLLHRLPGITGVASVTGVSVETGRWVNPWTRQEHPIRIWGMDLQADVLGLPGIDPRDPVLRQADAALFDERSRPKFGPVADELRAGRPVQVEVNGRRISIIGLTTAGISVGVDGNLFTTPANFTRLVPGQPPGVCHLGVVRLAEGVDAERVLATAQAMLGAEATVMLRPAIVAAEIAYMRANEPVDAIMTMIAGVAFAVGMIIVYQILYTDVISHLPQFATLKAMGFSNGYLLRIVMWEGAYLCLIGFWPGLVAAVLVTQAAQSAIMLPVEISAARAVMVLGLTFLMCTVAAAAAVRKLAQADPANVF